MDVIREKLKLLPEAPGVYIMLDAGGAVIYVGKAKVLKNRVRQYFNGGSKPVKVARMVECVADFNYIIAESEIAALALENNLIKKYKPRYNILLKDDKTYPYIKANVKADYPNFVVTRKVRRDGAKYFGPFMGGINCNDILDTLQLAYGVRLCSTPTTGKRRECLNYHIGRCAAPCAGKISKEDYKKRVDGALDFLEGRYSGAEKFLREKMTAAADCENFELAMQYRDKIDMLSKLEDRRITSLNRDIDADIVAYTSNGIYSAASVLVTRKGIMQGGFNYALEEASAESGDGLTEFLTRYYSRHEPPAEIICQNFCEKDLLEDYFKQLGKSVEITIPRRGDKLQLLEMAKKNAEDYLSKSVEKIKHKEDMTVNACKRLRDILSLKRYPKRMECFDISDISGVDKVGSMVVFSDGEPDRSSYRRFKIKTVEGADDFACMQEVLTRRLSKLGTDEEERFPRPDLVIIDGGKGQLSAAKEIFDRFKIDDIDLVALAKKEEEIFTLDPPDSVQIDRGDYALKMLQRIRDEAHRFGITYFRSLHSKNSLRSVLLDVEGVGKARCDSLMETFGSLSALMDASAEQIARCDGVSMALAEKIKERLENL